MLFVGYGCYRTAPFCQSSAHPGQGYSYIKQIACSEHSRCDASFLSLILFSSRQGSLTADIFSHPLPLTAAWTFEVPWHSLLTLSWLGQRRVLYTQISSELDSQYAIEGPCIYGRQKSDQGYELHIHHTWQQALTTFCLSDHAIDLQSASKQHEEFQMRCIMYTYCFRDARTGSLHEGHAQDKSSNI